jgi:hypothetical protein
MSGRKHKPTRHNLAFEGWICLERPSRCLFVRVVETGDVPPAFVMEYRAGRNAVNEDIWLPFRGQHIAVSQGFRDPELSDI